MKATYRFGMGVSVSTAGSQTGSAKAETVIIAVSLDQEGRVADLVMDGAEIRIPVAEGAIAGTDRTTVFKTRYENRKRYGKDSGIALWCAQAEGFRAAVMGKTLEEIGALEAFEDGSGNLVQIEETEAGRTMRETLLKAGRDKNANTFTAEAYSLRLAVLSKVDPTSRSASGTEQGVAGLFSSFVAVALDDEGRVLSLLADGAEPRIFFQEDGSIGETLYSGSLRETGGLPGMKSWESGMVGCTGSEIEAEYAGKDSGYPAYWRLAAKAAAFCKEVRVNSRSYPLGETVRIPVTDRKEDRFAAIMEDDIITYRMLTEEEQQRGEICVEASGDMNVKFYRYGFYIDDRCVIAGDTGSNRILLSDYLPEGYEDYYCFGYDSSSGGRDTDGVGCMCATNDLWKVFHVRYVYTGYYQIQVKAEPGKEIVMRNREKAYKAAPIPPGAVFPFCDADNPEHLKPAEEGRRIAAGTYYVKKGTVFTDGVTSYEITGNAELHFS